MSRDPSTKKIPEHGCGAPCFDRDAGHLVRVLQVADGFSAGLDENQAHKGSRGILTKTKQLLQGSKATQEAEVGSDQRLGEQIRSLISECRSPCAAPGGGWANQNEEHARRGRSVLSQLVREMGSSLLKGQSIMNVSVPVQCCQPRSALELGADSARLSHIFLSAAAATTDPLQRMKWVVSGAVAALSLTADAFLKPLNPLLGETLQVEYGDGSKMYMEQTSHHPPVLAFLLCGRGGAFRMSGHQRAAVSLGLNKLLFTSTGRYEVTFADGGRVHYDFPSDRVLNLCWGKMVHEVVGEQRFEDSRNGLRCTLRYGNPSGLPGVPSDWFEGDIRSFDPQSPALEDGAVLSRVQGSWLGFCDVDGARYWDITKHSPMSVAAPAVTLPSDSRNRPDIRWLAGGEVKRAQGAKVALEEGQRRERRLREKGLR